MTSMMSIEKVIIYTSPRCSKPVWLTELLL